MTRMMPSALAFAAGFGLASAFVPPAPSERGAPAPQAVVADAAPWSLHRAGPVLAQESREMRALRAAGRRASLEIGPR